MKIQHVKWDFRGEEIKAEIRLIRKGLISEKARVFHFFIQYK